MESLEVIAVPHFSKTDLAWLTDIRSRRAGSRGTPYFTLVFSSFGISQPAFVKAVKAYTKDSHAIRFRLRSALVVPEHAIGRFHVFLIPDEGFGAILKLHDALHTGVLKDALRQDSPYLPHVTVATMRDYSTARDLALALNQGGVDIHGHIDTLLVETRSGADVRVLAEAPLSKGSWFG
jgi:hypothetical protein